MFLLKLNDVAAFGCEKTYSLISIIIYTYTFATEVNFGDKFSCPTFKIFELI